MSDGEKTRRAIAAQPEWLARLPTDRWLPPGPWLFTGCGTSFHAAQTGGVGAPVTLVPTRHTAVDIVSFQLLTVDLAEARSIDPDPIRRDDPRRARAREAYA